MKKFIKAAISFCVLTIMMLSNTMVIAASIVENDESNLTEENNTTQTENNATLETNTDDVVDLENQVETTTNIQSQLSVQEETIQQVEEVAEPMALDNNSTTTIDGKETIEEGIYIIRSSIDPRFVLDVNGASQDNGANIQLYEYSNDNQKKFKVTYLGDGYYSIIAMHSNKALDVKFGGTTIGTNVWQYEWTNTEPQKWQIKKTEDGNYNIIAKCNGLYLDVYNGVAANYTNIQMCNGNGLNAQKFKFEKVVEPEPVIGSQTLADGTYVIRSAIDNKFVLDVNRSI